VCAELDLVKGNLVLSGGPRHGIDRHAGQNRDRYIGQCRAVGDVLSDAPCALHIAQSGDHMVRIQMTGDAGISPQQQLHLQAW
jgi:hypothetical protein